MIKRMILNNHNRRRMIRFNLLRQQLCPLCGDIICFDNKKNLYACRNTECDFKEEKVLLSEADEILIKENIIKNS